jgi:hypothetical protein
MKQLDNFYLNQEEPIRGLLLALRDTILLQDIDITNEWKYRMPFFCYKGKMFCYIWIHKKHNQPYIGIVEGKRFNEPFLIQDKRSRMKIMVLDPSQDLPIQTIESIIKKAIDFYKTGVIKINERKNFRRI